ncbi:MAG: peptidoglycan DD-metalloendopeptidase family protein [Ruminococcus sp.]|nr:peptidoglycan DD-metalloendopeptidase family protein [Ruminococcus sp.]
MSKLCIIKRILTILTCIVLTVTLMAAYSENAADNSIEAKTITEIQEERKQNEEKIAALQDEIDSLENDAVEEEEYQKTLSEQIELLQDNIELLDVEINQLSADIAAAEENINALSEGIEAQEAQVEENIELFKERLCAMYVTGNNGLVSAVLGSTDFYDMLSRVEMVNNIAAHDEELVNNLLEEINTLETSKANLEIEKLNLEMNKTTQETKKKGKEEDIEQLSEAIQKSQDEIDRLALEKKRTEKSVEELEADNKLLEAQENEIREAEEAAKKAAAEEAAKQAATEASNDNSGSSDDSSSNSSDDTSSSDDSSSYTETDTSTSDTTTTTTSVSGFAWPAPGYYYISSGYGYRWGSLHAGIDIAGGGISGASACASKAGTVIAVSNSCSHNYPKSSNCCGNGYGNYVLISHGDGTTTLYGHLGTVSVSVGDYVSQGQAVGTIGSTGYSTGYHLHFEIRINGTAVDPSNYL